MSEDKLAVVLVRSRMSASKEIKDTLDMLKLESKFDCRVVDKTDSYLGMVEKVKDFVTWGEVSEDSIEEISDFNDENESDVYNLPPPDGGFENKGIKISFSAGGALGYRGEDINDLLGRMS